MRGWDTVPAEELNASSPRVDAAANIEFLYRSLVVNDRSDRNTAFTYHYRAKIFNEAGIQELDKIDIAYPKGWRVRDISARIIYPNGSVTVLDSGEIYKRQIFKDDRFTSYAKSFSFPGLKVGCIVEYKWKELRRHWTDSLVIPLRAKWGTWRYDVTIRPYTKLSSLTTSHNCDVAFQKKGKEFSLSISDEPAFSSASYLAPRLEFEPWIHLGYSKNIKHLEKDEYWRRRGGRLIEINRVFVKANQREIEKLAEQVYSGLVFDDDKLVAAYDYCASNFLNIDEYQTRYTEEEIEALKENENPNDTIRNGYGSRYDINSVFASLATAAGFMARLAMVENHSVFSHRRSARGSYNLGDWVVAIKYGEGWRYFDPGSSFLPFEVLNPENVAADSMQTDDEFYYMYITPDVSDDFSTVSRTADVSIDAFGDLEGRVDVTYEGYSGLWRKRLFESMTDKEVADYLQDNDWLDRLPRAKIRNVKIENSKSRDQSLTVSYDLKIPGYADVVRDRLIFNPSLFEREIPGLFEDEKRSDPIVFEFKERFIDEVKYEVPKGYELENQSDYLQANEGYATWFKSVSYVDLESGKLLYSREFKLRKTRMDMNRYQEIKSEFEYVYRSDSRLVGFKKIAELSAL